jgi:hypothetical protein
MSAMTTTPAARPDGHCIDGLSHVWLRRIGADGFPKSMSCQRCGVSAPEAFCRTPQTCYVAGRCLAEVCCND